MKAQVPASFEKWKGLTYRVAVTPKPPPTVSQPWSQTLSVPQTKQPELLLFSQQRRNGEISCIHIPT